MSWVRWTAPVLLAIAVTAGGCGGTNNPNPAGAGSDDGGDGAGLPAGVVAKVGTTTIPQAALAKQVNIYYSGSAKMFGPPHYTACVSAAKASDPNAPASETLAQCKLSYHDAATVSLGTLLHAEWLNREARRQGIDVNPDVKKALDQAKQLRALARGRKGLAIRQPPHPDLATTIRTATQQQKLMAAIPLTEQAIKDYANAASSIFLESEDRSAHFLQTNTRTKALNARNDLQHGATWRHIQHHYKAKQYAGHDWTGIQTITKGGAPQDALGRALYTAKAHKLTGPIHTLNGWFVFQITTIKPPKHKTLTAEGRLGVTSTLRSKRLDEILHDHYAKQTICQPQYQTPQAPQCE